MAKQLLKKLLLLLLLLCAQARTTCPRLSSCFR
jgi:hypothetical protein